MASGLEAFESLIDTHLSYNFFLYIVAIHSPALGGTILNAKGT